MSFNLSYDFFTRKPQDLEYIDDSYYKDVNFELVYLEDSDWDKITDLDDYCPKTPKDVKVTVLEDVVTTGGSSIKAVEKLRDAGYIVEKVVALVDRQEGGEEAMKEAGLELVSIFKLPEFEGKFLWVNFNLI